MLGGLLAAWLFVPLALPFVFPLAALAVGTHYLAFRTVYGDRAYWLLGALMIAVALVALFRLMPVPGGLILAIAVIEAVFAVLLTLRSR